MEEWLHTIITTILSTAITALISGIVALVVKNQWAKRDERRKKEQKLLDEEKGRMRNNELNQALQTYVAPLNTRLESIEENLTKTNEGTLCSLRKDILECYYRCEEKGYKNSYDADNMHKLYDAYHDLHGNSFVEEVMSKFNQLPLMTDDEASKLKKKRSSSTKKVLNETI